LIRQRFTLATRRLRLARNRDLSLDCSLFRVPQAASPQAEMFSRD
jgi:hypothetical protein